MSNPLISNVSIVPSKGKFGVVIDVLYRDKTTHIIDSIEDDGLEAFKRATELCQLWDLKLIANI